MTQKGKKTKEGIPRCSKCGSSQVYFRQTLKQNVCKTCGNVESSSSRALPLKKQKTTEEKQDGN